MAKYEKPKSEPEREQLRAEEEEWEELDEAFGFNQKILPWLVAGGALALYLITLCRWLRLENLSLLASVLGWDPSPQLERPLYFLLTRPFLLLPAKLQPLALNALAAVLGAATAGLLTRCVALLPYDRTREAREREQNPLAFLSIPFSWLPPLAGGVLLVVGLNVWEHGTVAAGEMLDLLLFAYLVRCLLEYRTEDRESWMYRFAFLYGLAVANNYAMIGFFPCFLIAVLWIKGIEAFQIGWLLRMAGLGVAGLLLYLLLPLVHTLREAADATFWEYLRSELARQKSGLLSVPRYAILVISLTTILPTLLMGVRWRSNREETSAAGTVFNAYLMHLLHAVMFAAALSVFFDAKWTPRGQLPGRPLLPFYFLAALAAAYYGGYLMLTGRPAPGRHRRPEPPGMGALRTLFGWLAPVAAAAVPLYVAAVNFPVVWQERGLALRKLAADLTQPLADQPTYLVADSSLPLLLAEAGLRDREAKQSRVRILSRLLPFHSYHDLLRRYFGALWPELPNLDKMPDPIPEPVVGRFLMDLAASNRVYYLHPSMGYFFESVGLEPEALIYRVRPLPAEPSPAPPLSTNLFAANLDYWKSARSVWAKLPKKSDREPVEIAYVRSACSRAAATWGAALQRGGRLNEAAEQFRFALDLLPENLSAEVSLEFNRWLQKPPLPPLDLAKPLLGKGEEAAEGSGEAGRDPWFARRAALKRHPNRSLEWSEIILSYGFLDHPNWCFQLGRAYAKNGFYRQAYREFARVQSLYPTNEAAQLWAQSAKAMVYLAQGRVKDAEQTALALKAKHPKRELVLDTLTQIYMLSGQLTNALAAVKEELALNPDYPRALLNQAAVLIRLKRPQEAIPPLNRLLTAHPDHWAGRLDRAIAYFQSGQLDRAAQDYRILAEAQPDSYLVWYGLGEIAYRKQDWAKALECYEKYLKLAPRKTSEYEQVTQRVKELRAKLGAAAN